jgi:hypothetical protein
MMTISNILYQFESLDAVVDLPKQPLCAKPKPTYPFFHFT